MKLSMTNRTSGQTAVVADKVDTAICPMHLNRDGTLSVAVIGNGGHAYTLSGSREDWQALARRAKDLFGTSMQIEGDRAPGFSGLFIDPTPQLSEGVRQDMEASALDAFHKWGDCDPKQLWLHYGFSPSQVTAFGDEAIAAARTAWEKEGGCAA